MQKLLSTDAEIKSAGLNLMSRGKKITGSSLRSSLGGGETYRLIGRWQAMFSQFPSDISTRDTACRRMIFDLQSAVCKKIEFLIDDCPPCDRSRILSLASFPPFKTDFFLALSSSCAALGLVFATRSEDLMGENESPVGYMLRFLLDYGKLDRFPILPMCSASSVWVDYLPRLLSPGLGSLSFSGLLADFSDPDQQRR